MVVLEPRAGEPVVYSDGEAWYWTTWQDELGHDHISLMCKPFSGDSSKVMMASTPQHMAELLAEVEAWP